MAVNLSYRETQLVKRFRELDERGKQLIEVTCQSQTDISIRDSADQTTHPALVLKVEHLAPRRRAVTEKLIEILNEVDAFGTGRLCGMAEYCVTKFPRYPKKPAVDTKGLCTEAIEICTFIEQMSDRGLNELIRRAVEIRNEYPRLPKKSAVVFSLVDGG